MFNSGHLLRRTLAGMVVGITSVMTYGDADALFQQGAALFKSEPEKAYPLFVQAAEEGNVAAMVGAGHCLENGTGTPIDYSKAIEWYEKAVAQNNLTACEALARLYASCPEPQFHDGEKAVKYAEALVRKNPKDAEALALLAAAHARNMDFDQAARVASKAGSLESRAVESTALKQRKEAYSRGEPYPPIATQAWMLQAMDRHSGWAAARMIGQIADPFDPLYDAEKAIRLCNARIKAGDKSLYLALGNLFLDAGDLDEAHDAYERYVEYCIKERDSFRPPQRIYLSYVERPVLDIMKVARLRRGWWIDVHGKGVDAQGREYSYGGQFATLEEAQTYVPQAEASRVWYPPDMAAVEFLLKVAAIKGDQTAQNQLTALHEQMKQSRAVLASRVNPDNVIWAASLSEEALKYCNNNVLPVNISLAEAFYRKSYEINPTPRTAYILGRLYLRDCLYTDQYNNRPVDEAIRWLNVAHAKGFQPATRRLIEVYACDPDPEVCDGKLALQYASAYAETCPAEDHVALRLMACAYARNDQYDKAIQAMQKALECCPGSDWTEKGKYTGELARFEDHKAVFVRYAAYSYNKDSILFTDMLKEQD